MCAQQAGSACKHYASKKHESDGGYAAVRVHDCLAETNSVAVMSADNVGAKGLLCHHDERGGILCLATTFSGHVCGSTTNMHPR